MPSKKKKKKRKKKIRRRRKKKKKLDHRQHCEGRGAAFFSLLDWELYSLFMENPFSWLMVLGCCLVFVASIRSWSMCLYFIARIL